VARSKSQFVCQQCGYIQSQWAGKCPNCDTWNSLVETQTQQENRRAGERGSVNPGRMYKLSEVKVNERQRIKTGEKELDSVLGGGLVPGMVVLVAGEPGIGKSTILTQVSLKIGNSRPEVKIMYVCGEESASQVALRVKRLEGSGSRIRDSILLFESTNADEIEAEIEKEKPGLIIVDSIQALTTTDLTGTAGSVGQVRECAQRLTNLAKRIAVPMFLVGHVTKEGNVAGPAVLMHVVDTVLWFEGDRSQSLRIIRAVKNRFGPTDEVGVFEMSESGLAGIDDPSRLLLAERVKNVPGSVISVVLEGRRPILAEIQALTSPSQLVVPRRVATGVDFARMQTLVAVLMRRANLHLEGVDIFVNVTGGIKLADRGVDLAICLAISSAFLNKTLPADVVAVGEVGLLGEVRKVQGLDRRVKEAKKLGFRVASAESGRSVAAAIKKLLD
jgi:DNA repair protein RadA/Sms